MKFLPAQPPPADPALAQQGGALGSFSRASRPPVDPRRPRAVATRGAFGWGARYYRFADAPTRASWDARAGAGVAGSAQSAGVNAANALRDAGAVEVSPGGVINENVTFWSASFSLSGGFLLDLEVIGATADAISVIAAAPRPVSSSGGAAYVAIATRSYSGRTVYDVTADYVSRWGVPPLGYNVLFGARFWDGLNFGRWGQTSVQVTA